MAQQTNPPEDSLRKPGRGWSVHGVGKRWQLWFFHTLIRLGGRRPAYHVMYVVVLWYVLFIPSIRRRTHHYLSRRFPGRRSVLRRFWDSYRLVYTFGRTIIDRATLAIAGAPTLEASFSNGDTARRVVDQSDGAVLVNAHIGCWQATMTTLGHFNRSVSLVMIPPEGNEPMAQFRQEGLPFKIIDPRNGLESVLEMMQALEQGEILGVMGDRVFGTQEGTVTATFLGDKVELPFSPYRLAAASGKPIIVLFSHKVGFKQYDIQLARVIHVPKSARTPEQCQPAAQEFVDAMELFLQEHPWQFFNFYDLWSGPSQDADVAAPTNCATGRL